MRTFYLPDLSAISMSPSATPGAGHKSRVLLACIKRSTKSISLTGHYYRSNSWNDQSEVSIYVSIRSNISINVLDQSVRYYLPTIRAISIIVTRCIKVEKRVSSSGELGWQSGLGLWLVERWSWVRIPLDLCFFHLHRMAEFEAHKLTLVLFSIIKRSFYATQ